MGSGCVCQNSSSSHAFSRIRAVRLGNLNFMIHENKTVGKGCKRTPAWETLATREEINKKIKEFWDTRIEGNPEIWKVLREACMEPLSTISEKLIKASGLSMLSGSLMLTFDEVGFRYDLPIYVINEAHRYGVEKAVLKLPDNFQGEAISLSMRCVKFTDERLTVNTGESIRSVKEKYGSRVEVPPENLRLFFNGKEMKNEMTLHHCRAKDGVVLQVHVAGNS